MLTPINEGFVEQWRSVGATDAELAEVVARDGSTVSADMDHPNVSRWIRLVAIARAASMKPVAKMRPPEPIPDDHDPLQEQRRMKQGGCCGQAAKSVD